MVGAGAYVLSLNDLCTTAPVAPVIECQRLYRTNLPGGLLVGLGGAALLSGSLLLALPGSASESARSAQ